MSTGNARSLVLVVTAQSLYRECLRSAIRSFLVEAVVETAGTVQRAQEICQQEGELLIVFDIDGLPAFSPADIRKFTQLFPQATILVFGRRQHEKEAVEYLESGAADFRVTDSESLERFCEVIDQALRGETSHGPERTKAIFSRLRQLSAEVSRISEIDTSVLTDREMEILRLIDEGRANKEIAKSLSISRHTVKNHVHRILEKLEASNRREAVHMAYTNGWLKVEAG